jgi:hypothetical protein
MRGDSATANEYATLAQTFAQRWIDEADDGDHFRLAFDRPGTWSQKYNLVWDRILNLNLFPDQVRRKEMDYYRKVQNTYGLPLDNRSQYTKLDWILWTATLTRNQDDFSALMQPVYRFLNETPDRVPMTDWYWTQDARLRGFRARPVVGGVFLQMLYDQAAWAKYASRDQTKAENWAPFPTPPKLQTIVPTAEQEKITWRYTTETPDDDWMKPNFNDSSWKTGNAGFGTSGTPGAAIGTVWNTRNIWLRRTFELKGTAFHDLHLLIHHDEDADVYVNGVRIASLAGFTTGYETMMLRADAKAALKPGGNILAIRCRQTGGGQYIDAGLVDVVPGNP